MELDPEEPVTELVDPRETLTMGVTQETLDLEKLEEDLFSQVSVILSDAMRFRDIAEDAAGPPLEWVELLGYDNAMKRFRIAQAAWRSAKDVPAGLKLAKDAMVGMVRARATREMGPRVLNATLIQTSAPMPIFPERIVDK